MKKVNFTAAAAWAGLSLPERRPDGYGNPTWRWTVPGRPISLTVSQWSSTVAIVVESHGEISRLHHGERQAVALVLAIVEQWGWQHDNGDKE